MTEMTPLRRRMIDDMTVRNLSPATQRSYVHAVAKFARFFGRSPEKLDLEDVRAFQVHLVAGGMSWPALNQTVCALRFLYGVTLRQADLPERIAYAREPQKLPVVLSTEEVVRFLEAVPSLKCRAALTTAYAAGLRASEVANLKVADLDSSRMVIRVEQGKGAVVIVTSCSRRNYSASCGPIGAWRDRHIGCFPATTANIQSIPRH
jgi:integrase/recombinase XerD